MNCSHGFEFRLIISSFRRIFFWKLTKKLHIKLYKKHCRKRSVGSLVGWAKNRTIWKNDDVVTTVECNQHLWRSIFLQSRFQFTKSRFQLTETNRYHWFTLKRSFDLKALVVYSFVFTYGKRTFFWPLSNWFTWKSSFA